MDPFEVNKGIIGHAIVIRSQHRIDTCQSALDLIDTGYWNSMLWDYIGKFVYEYVIAQPTCPLPVFLFSLDIALQSLRVYGIC